MFGCHRVNGTGGGTYNVQQQGVASGKLPLSSFFASPFVRPPARSFLDGPPLLIVPSASHRTLSQKSSLVDGVSGVTERHPCFVSQYQERFMCKTRVTAVQRDVPSSSAVPSTCLQCGMCALPREAIVSLMHSSREAIPGGFRKRSGR